MASFGGRFSDQPLVLTLGRILSERRSGVLKASLGAMIRQLFLEKGTVIRYAASNLLPESLSEHLKRQGRFRAEEMRQATASKQPNELLSSALLRLGFISPEDHQVLVREMIENVVVATANWPQASFEFMDGELPFTQPGDAGLPVPVAVLGLTQHVTDLRSLQSRFEGEDQKVRMSSTPPMPLESVPLGPAEGYLVSRADGTLTVREISMTSPLEPEETQRALYGLILAGYLVVDGVAAPFTSGQAGGTSPSLPRPAAPARRAPSPSPGRRPAGPVEEMLERFQALQGQSLYQVLGVSPTASESDVRHAYYSLAKRLHPDKFTDDETKNQAEKLFAAITEAYATLSRPESRKEYDQAAASQRAPDMDAAQSASAGAELARQNFLRGRTLSERGEIVKALPFFEHAVEQDGTKEEYWRYLAMVQSRNPRLRKEAERSFLKAIDLNPTQAENYAQLGLLYRKAGQAEKAEEYLQRALSWDATNSTAREALGADDSSRKGTFRSLFRK